MSMLNLTVVLQADSHLHSDAVALYNSQLADRPLECILLARPIDLGLGLLAIG